ncbi:hypothetical protein L218DRAFT_309578 [Marasmius fiardii PR-910]|nr:hypothetical protein L218DRAFT_309578 [Marasmius fiardii PR-910]
MASDLQPVRLYVLSSRNLNRPGGHVKFEFLPGSESHDRTISSARKENDAEPRKSLRLPFELRTLIYMTSCIILGIIMAIAHNAFFLRLHLRSADAIVAIGGRIPPP